MVRPVAKLGEVKRHLLAADMNVRRADAVLEQLPEAFDAVRVEGFARPVIVIAPFLRAVLNGAVNEAVALTRNVDAFS